MNNKTPTERFRTNGITDHSTLMRLDRVKHGHKIVRVCVCLSNTKLASLRLASPGKKSLHQNSQVNKQALEYWNDKKLHFATVRLKPKQHAHQGRDPNYKQHDTLITRSESGILMYEHMNQGTSITMLEGEKKTALQLWHNHTTGSEPEQKSTDTISVLTSERTKKWDIPNHSESRVLQTGSKTNTKRICSGILFTNEWRIKMVPFVIPIIQCKCIQNI